MKILALYANTGGYGRIPTGLAIIITVLAEAGHDLELFDTTFLEVSNRDNDLREEAGIVIPVPLQHMYEGMTQAQIDTSFIDKLNLFSPEMLIASVVEDNYPYAHHFFEIAKKINPNLPVMVGGPTPSAAPEVMIENTCIDYLIQGEGEAAAVEVCEHLEKGETPNRVANLWYKEDGKVRNNPIRPFLEMDGLPIQNLDIWDRRHFHKPYDGKLYWTGYFEMSRGCPFLCTYCVNGTIQKSLRSAGKFFRRKHPAVAIREIKHHVEAMNLERVVFCDDNFLLMPGKQAHEWGELFSKIWVDEVNLPYWIATSAEFITPEAAQMLQKSGCDGVGLGVEAGGEWFRRHILKRNVDNKRLANSFSNLHEVGIRSTANIMMGYPGESEEDIFDTVRLIRKINPDSYDISIVAPYIGTGIHTVAAQLGFIELRTDPGFKGMATEISFRDHSTIQNPMISPERIIELHRTFSDYVSGKRQIPKIYDETSGKTTNWAPPENDFRWKVAEAIKAA
jgi:anaerobic magnesium-protoporphyrin IX monomethyl ester cyclase